MSRKHLCILNVRGRDKEWGWYAYLSDEAIKEQCDDGLDVGIICAIIPQWVVNLGLERPYAFVQDIFNFRNPF